MLRRIPKSSPYYEQAQIEVAGGLMAMGRDKEARKLLRKAARGEDAREARFAYANMLASEGEQRAAAGEYGKLIDALPENPPSDAWRLKNCWPTSSVCGCCGNGNKGRVRRRWPVPVRWKNAYWLPYRSS